jgi:hypothetical protein
MPCWSKRRSGRLPKSSPRKRSANLCMTRQPSGHSLGSPNSLGVLDLAPTPSCHGCEKVGHVHPTVARTLPRQFLQQPGGGERQTPEMSQLGCQRIDHTRDTRRPRTGLASHFVELPFPKSPCHRRLHFWTCMPPNPSANARLVRCAGSCS